MASESGEAVDEIAVFGESEVGKTCFTDMVGLVHPSTPYPHLPYPRINVYLPTFQDPLIAFIHAYTPTTADHGPPFL
jgi:hypothetical protein